MSSEIAYRTAVPEDALTLSVLATQVFLDTYATRGVNSDLAKEARAVYSAEAFAKRLQDPNVEMTVAHVGEYMVGFLDLASGTDCPVVPIEGVEVSRLYVQAPFQGRGVGKRLMSLAESQAMQRMSSHIWLTAWAGNLRARAFYTSLGYRDVGPSTYVIEGQAYENRVFAKRMDAGAV